jgi:hypothetical protein
MLLPGLTDMQTQLLDTTHFSIHEDTPVCTWFDGLESLLPIDLQAQPCPPVGGAQVSC